MFKSARWKSDKNRTKALFKLQFYATQVPQAGWDALTVSLVPLEVGKPTAKSEKAAVRGGACRWENPVYETVKFSQDPKTGKTNERIYRLFVQTGSSRGSILGEIAIDFANYAEAVKSSSVSLPLKPANSGAILHVTITRMQAAVDGREEENGKFHVRTLKTQITNVDIDEISEASYDTNYSYRHNSSITSQAELDVSHNRSTSPAGFRPPNGFDVISGSNLDCSSEQNTPKLHPSKNHIARRDGANFLSSLSNNSGTQNPTEHRRSNTEWSVSSGPDGSTDDSTNSSDNILSRERSQGSDVSVEKLKNELVAMARQAELAELELQTLRKQIVKETRRGQDLSKEISSLKEERDAFRNKWEQLRASQQDVNKSCFDSGDPLYMLEEIRQELNYEKDLNANLRVQLQKTQESNSELMLAVNDLEELLEGKDGENGSKNLNPTGARLEDKDLVLIDSGSSQSKSNGNGKTKREEEMENDEEQQALEEIVREHDQVKANYSLEQKVIDLYSDIEVYKKDREELEMQMEQLALDYEILKQENHEISLRLEQSELREQLKMQYEGSGSLAVINELETHIESLEKELEKQAEAFEADLAELARAKVEQEQRAIRAEEALRKIKWNNASTAERLQEEFRRLSVQMASTFETNEKLAMQAQAEVTELRVQKCHLEVLLEKADEEHALMKDQYEAKLEEASKQLDMKSKYIDQLVSEQGERSEEAQSLKKHGEDREEVLMEELEKLQTEMQVLNRKNFELSECLQQMEADSIELERMGKLAEEEKDALRKGGNTQKDIFKEANGMKQQKEEKEAMASVLQAELEKLRSQQTGLKKSLLEENLEKESLRKEVLHLKSDIRKKEETIAIIEKKLKENTARSTVSDATAKTSQKHTNKTSPPSSCTKEVAGLREKVKALEDEMKLKEMELENASHVFLKKEKDMCSKIEELQKGMADLSEKNTSSPEDEFEDDKDAENRKVSSNGITGALVGSTVFSDIKEVESSTNLEDDPEFLSEIALLKTRNKAMENELKEMQERYSEISLKFAEVEGERQQLVMTVRNLKNAKKS